MRRTMAGALVAMIALGATGCAGSETHRLTKTQFATRADAICKQSTERQNVLMQSDPKKVGGIQHLRAALVANLRQQVVRLEAFHPPSDAAAAFDHYKQIVTERRRLFEQRIRDIDKIKNQDSHKAGTEMNEIELREGATVSQGQRLAQQLGLTDCR